MDKVTLADAALWIGKEMMECGADSSSVEDAILSFLSSQGFDKVGVLVLPKSILVSLSTQDEVYTKMKHIDDVVPHFERLFLLRSYCYKPSMEFSRFKESILLKKSPFGFWSFFAVPIGCASFGVLLGADTLGALAVFVASLSAFAVKAQVTKFVLSAMFVNLICAFVATLAAYFLSKLLGVSKIEQVQAASTFFLIPGIQLINTFEDMLKGHYLNGAARGLRALFLSFGIVFGTTLAILIQRSLGWI